MVEDNGVDKTEVADDAETTDNPINDVETGMHMEARAPRAIERGLICCYGCCCVRSDDNETTEANKPAPVPRRLSARELLELKRAFNLIDQDESGYIDVAEVQRSPNLFDERAYHLM